jgi:multidrug efflux system membrane fusion protein
MSQNKPELTTPLFQILRPVGHILLALGLVCAVGCTKKNEEQKTRPPAIVQVELSTQKDVPVYIDAFGQLVAPNNVDIVPQVSGKLQEACFVEGQSVQAGDILFKIDPAEYQAALDRNKAALLADQADYKQKLDLLERNRKLFEQKLVSEETFTQYQAAVDMAAARIKQDEASIVNAEIQLGYCTIRSPIQGITGKRQVDPGNVVGVATKLVNIRSADPLFVDFTVPEKYLPVIREAHAKGTLDIHFVPERDVDPIMQEALKKDQDHKSLVQQFIQATYEGKLVFVDNTVDNTTGTIALRAQADNKAGTLWPGQFVILGLTVETVKDAVLVPGPAVLYGKQGPYAFVIGDDNKAQLRLLKLGPDWMGYLLIKEGIQPGEKVVTTGQLALYPGAQVMVAPSQPQQAKQAAGGKPDAKTMGAGAEAKP